MEPWQPYRYLSRPRPGPAPIADSPFHRFVRAIAWAFLVSLLTASPLVLPKAILGLHSTSSDVLGDLVVFGLITALLTIVITPISLAMVSQDYRRAKQTCPDTPPLLTRRDMLLSRLGLAVILASLLGIFIAFLAAPDIFAAADKSTSDMNFGYLLPFFIPAPAMVLLTLPIFAILSWPNRGRS